MELQGKIIAETPERSGVSARGEWKAKDFVLETHEAYPHKMVFSVLGADRLARFNVQVGQEVLVSFDIDAHEYNGRWFNSIRAFDVRQVDPSQFGVAPAAPGVAPFAPAPATSVSAASPAGGSTAAPFPPQSSEGESADDLPF